MPTWSDILKTWGPIILGITAAIAAIVCYLRLFSGSSNTTLREELREKFLRELHENGEAEITDNDPIVSTTTGAWFEMQHVVQDLKKDGTIESCAGKHVVGMRVTSFVVHYPTDKGNQYLEQKFGSPAKIARRINEI